MSKLLHKPLKVFVAYSLVILALSIPAYYYIIDSIWLEELDEHNQIVREQTQNGFNNLKPEDLTQGISLWNQLQPQNIVTPYLIRDIPPDSIYTIQRELFHNGNTEVDRFRGLLTTITIHGNLYRMNIETNMEEADETVLAISLITCVFIALLITGFALLNRRLSKRIWKPFYETLTQLKDFDLTKEKKIGAISTDIEEFAELNQTLERLIDKSIRSYKLQKEFTQNASHELQTPLALLKSKLDLLIQDNSITNVQRQIIESLNTSVSRISRINKNLLLLAKIEHQNYLLKDVNIEALIIAHLDLFKTSIENKSIHVEENIPQKIIVAANEGLADILIGNLMANAVRYSLAEGRITITLTEKGFTIKNSGTRALDESAIFKRFSSASFETPGSGLGLAIVKEISNKLGWKVSYDFRNPEHIFSVTF